MAANKSTEAAETFEQILKQRDVLQTELNECLAQIDGLTQELTETNQGVVALYAELDDRQAADLHVMLSELKSRFLSYMSHEFRTPLGSIRSLTRILLDGLDGPLTDEQEKQIRFIQGSAEELDRNGKNDLLGPCKNRRGPDFDFA